MVTLKTSLPQNIGRIYKIDNQAESASGALGPLW